MAETQNIPHLDLKFYNSSATLPGVVANNANAITLAFDKANDLIGINNFWFGSKHLPLTGGTVTGPIVLSANSKISVNNDSNRPAIAYNNREPDPKTNGTFGSGWAVEVGNTNMRLRLTSGATGYLYHYYQGSPANYEALILDAKNTRVSDYSINNIQYGYTLSLPQGINDASGNHANDSNSTYNLLGIGKLGPSITVDNNGQMKITVGGEESNTVPIYASSFVGNNYFSYDNSSKYLYHLLGANASIPIEIGEGITIDKVVHENPETHEEYSGSDANRPGNYHLKISIDSSILTRIGALESKIVELENKHDVSLSFIE